jgi:hypothetical protein
MLNNWMKMNNELERKWQNAGNGHHSLFLKATKTCEGQAALYVDNERNGKRPFYPCNVGVIDCIIKRKARAFQ